MKGTKPQLVIDNDALQRPPAPPAWLSSEAKKEWRRVVPGLVERQILADVDLGSLENYCICIGRIRDTEAKIQTEKDTDLMLKLVRAQDKAMASARQLAAELGLTPVSRSRPTVRRPADGDEDVSPMDIR